MFLTNRETSPSPCALVSVVSHIRVVRKSLPSSETCQKTLVAVPLGCGVHPVPGVCKKDHNGLLHVQACSCPRTLLSCLSLYLPSRPGPSFLILSPSLAENQVVTISFSVYPFRLRIRTRRVGARRRTKRSKLHLICGRDAF